ncbi:MAG TPA: RidA family protein [Streptosporangiaceae bacterium]|jgi:enamine deaminase RidA (YjgF/YER057c/UK114 family)
MSNVSDTRAAGITSVPDGRDERFAAVTMAGDLAFVAGVEGRFAPGSAELDRDSFRDGVRQSRNAYTELVRRLEQAGLSARHLVRVENLTASQDFRLKRMALWPEIFGRPTQAVSQGAQTKMRGQNMITATGVAYRDPGDIEVITAGPDQGRASRISRAGSWYFVIGVRGEKLLGTGEKAVDDVPDPLAVQADFAYRNIEHHLAAAGLSRGNLVRYDCYLRDISQAMRHRDIRTGHFDGRMPVSSTVVGCALGGSTDVELSAMAVGDGLPVETVFYPGRADLARTVRAGDFVFASGALGNRNVAGKPVPEAFGNPPRQLDLALERIEASLGDFGANLADVVRLDVFIRDAYGESAARDLLAGRFAGLVPATTFTGCELEPSAEVEVTAIAYKRAGA